MKDAPTSFTVAKDAVEHVVAAARVGVLGDAVLGQSAD